MAPGYTRPRYVLDKDELTRGIVPIVTMFLGSMLVGTKVVGGRCHFTVKKVARIFTSDFWCLCFSGLHGRAAKTITDRYRQHDRYTYKSLTLRCASGKNGEAWLSSHWISKYEDSDLRTVHHTISCSVVRVIDVICTRVVCCEHAVGMMVMYRMIFNEVYMHWKTYHRKVVVQPI